MPYLMGVDLGTSSVKAMLMDAEGNQRALAGEKYDVAIPRPFWAEQDPEMWWEKTAAVIARAVAESGGAADAIAAVGFSGQMHGLVCLGADGRPVRPAIIWQDQRSAEAIAEIHDRLGRDFVAGRTLNALSPGFLLASLYWLAKHEPENYEKTACVMLPKDYIKYRLSGVTATDYSDAAGSLAFDNLNLRWATEMLLLLDLDPDKLAPAFPSVHAVGTVTAEAARQTGLSPRTAVVNGGADQAMQAIGNGIVSDGIFSANIGTGGQISASMAKPVFDAELRTNTFAHALPNRWYIMGASLSAGASLKWLAKNVLRDADFARLDEGAALVPAGSGGLVFLPYLAGDRTPHLDPHAKGMFFGLTLDHNRHHFVRAVMEGVVFSLRDGMEILTGLGIPCRRLIASGGGAQSDLWLQMQADILGRDVYRSLAKEQACLGAALAAGVGAGVYAGFDEACGHAVKMDNAPCRPNDANARAYERGYGVYRELYRRNKELFHRSN